ncbi:MAG TPA: MgtC/SapB family protein [Methylomirabilota bacterium]|nr:MgtC/SapB family protein [Methylomirabilota bacterium]
MDLAEFVVRVAAALLFGAAIGFERQWYHRLAGLRTNTLVATGAAAFVALNGMVADGGPTRIAAQVVSGIGFLGAGVIFREGFNVRGLNTAATLWCAGAVGTLAGSGFVAAAGAATALVIAANILLRPLGHLVDRHTSKAETEVSCRFRAQCADTAEPEVRGLLLQASAPEHALVRALQSERTGDKGASVEAIVVFQGHRREAIERIAGRLRAHPAVSAVSWEIAGEAHTE